ITRLFVTKCPHKALIRRIEKQTLFPSKCPHGNRSRRTRRRACRGGGARATWTTRRRRDDRQQRAQDHPVRHVQGPTRRGRGGLADRAWFGIVAPTGTPVPIIEKLNGMVNQVLADPKIRSEFETKAFATAIGGTSEEFGTFLRIQQKFWREVLEASGVRPN